MAFCIAGLLPATCSAESTVIAAYRGGEITRADLETERRFGKTGQSASDPTLDVEAIVLRRVLAAGAPSLPPAARSGCIGRAKLREAQLSATELERSVRSASRPSEVEVREYYDDRLESFNRPQQWMVRNVFLRVPAGATAEQRSAARERLEAALAEVTTEEEFADLARSVSDSPTASRGGRIGYVSPSQLLPEAAAVLEGLEPGRLSAIFETEDGYTAFFCTDVRPARTLGFDDARRSISNHLERESFNKEWSSLDQSIQQRASLQLSLDAVAEGADDAIVLDIRLPDGAVRVNRATYLYWASTRGLKDPTSWTDERHSDALRDLALIYGRADVARRRGLTSGEASRERFARETEQATADCVLDHKAGEAVKPPTDEEIAATYRERKDRFVEPTRRDLDILTVEIGPPDPPAQFRELQRLGDEVRSGSTTFDEVASSLRAMGLETSVEALRAIPPIEVQSMGRGIADAVVAAAAGEVVGPVQDANRLMLVRVVTIHPERQLTLDEASPHIRHFLLRARLNDARTSISAAIVADREITYR